MITISHTFKRAKFFFLSVMLNCQTICFNNWERQLIPDPNDKNLRNDSNIKEVSGTFSKDHNVNTPNKQ